MTKSGRTKRRVKSRIFGIGSRTPIIIALILLILTPFILIRGNEAFANQIATYAYYFLVIGVVWMLIEYIGNEETK